MTNTTTIIQHFITFGSEKVKPGVVPFRVLGVILWRKGWVCFSREGGGGGPLDIERC